MTDDRVEAYYESNTKRFLRFGQGGQQGAIHRAVWGPGVLDRAEAFHYVDDRLLEAMPHDATRVLDLGCGVGASLAYIAERRDVHGVGVTLSATQVELATQRFARAGLGNRLSARRADFTDLPADLEPVDFAYAIEAFVHAPAPEPFFAEAARILRPGGRLAICDDFAAPRVDEGELTFREARWIREFRTGWNTGSLISVRRAEQLANAAGFERVSDQDLTADIELRRPRDRLITMMVRLGRRIPTRNAWWLNLLGGNALQMALVRRLMTYRVLVWTRR
ncbi:MAG: class I SAM-dependent methyltransferase [Myxococcota bacterium]